MDKPTTEKKELHFNQNVWYAPFAGWLAFPLIFTFISLIGALIMYIFVDPSELSGFDLNVYYADIVTIPYLLITYIFWIRRKRFLRILMIFYFVFIGAVNISYYVNGFQFDPFNLVMSIVWIFYFIRSKRVKATFTW